MWRVGLRLGLPSRALSPRLAKQIHQLAGRHTVAVVRAHVVPARKAPILILSLSNHQVRHHRLQHMLIGAGRVWVAHNDWLSLHRCADAVRDDAVAGKIPAADHIARPRRADRGITVLKEAVDIAVCRQLRTALAIGVRIIPVQRLVLPVTPAPLVVVIDLIGGDIHHRPHRRACGAHAFQQVDRAHDVGFICIRRLLVACPHNGLRGEMQHDFRLCRLKRGFQSYPISHIAANIRHGVVQSGEIKQVRLRRRIKAVACHDGPGIDQRAAHPRAFETGVAGDKDPFASIKA